jgi:polar amino acid transport system permease protein
MDEHQAGPAGPPPAGPPDAEFAGTELAGVGPPSASVGEAGNPWQPPGSFARRGRGSRLLGGASGTVISTTSTIVVVGALVAIFLLAPGARAVEHAFFNPQDMWASFVGDPQKGYYSVGAAIWLNIRMFLIAEVLILLLALAIALIRQSSHPALFPIRILATGYVDLFRGVPLILVIFAIGLGVPALSLPVVSDQSNAVYGVTALVLSYSAYVSEVYRAGLNSVHQSQVAAALSLGLPRRTALRHVILPQAVRNIIPPLLNDFISLQKDTALVGVLGTIEANKAAEIYSEQVFNFSSFTVAAILFLILTIPLARFTDRLIERDRRRRLAGVAP